MKNTGDSIKLEGTNNYAQNKTSKNLQKIAELEGQVGGDNKYPEMKGTKNYARNKTSQNLQKIAELEGQVGGDNKYPIGGHKYLRVNQNFRQSPKNCQVGGDNKYPIGGHK
jgi:hypothetical protein